MKEIKRTVKTYEDIRDCYTLDDYLKRLEKLTPAEARKIRDITDTYAAYNLHRDDSTTLRDNKIRSAIYLNAEHNSKFILKSVELSMIFFDERWYGMTLDFNIPRRSLEFNTSEENVIMYDALRAKTEEVLAKQKVKSL